ncbi:Alpha/Beta hydrolase protein [Cercophora samala]|uniref:Alpha/Beta hydrolase protein n=1 Tax=Cercophora samala TaxID=330535 RepID=A0AA39ZBV9_9PEZI|nr:Alpha/Beta hydrolase protein [Cercophora samala]
MVMASTEPPIELNLPPGAPPGSPPGFTDHAFVSGSGVKLSVRVWPADPPVEKPAPFVIWTHGGGWLGGAHFAPLPWLSPGFRSRGYHLVSHNYRLAPQARIDDQLSDCLESVSWLRSNLPSLLGQDKVDVDRYILVGESAGGHLVTLMAAHLSPLPKAVVDVYGLVDFLSIPHFCESVQFEPWKPDHPPPWKGEFTDAELDAFLVDRSPENLLTDALAWNEQEVLTEKQIQQYWATDFKYNKRIRLQAELHMRRSLNSDMEGLRNGVMHREKFKTQEDFVKFLEEMSPYRVLLRDQGRAYPPTAFMHGTGDDVVRIDQSYRMAELLKRRGVPVLECYEEGKPHVYDLKYINRSINGWDTYIQPVLDFVDNHVGPKGKD